MISYYVPVTYIWPDGSLIPSDDLRLFLCSTEMNYDYYEQNNDVTRVVGTVFSYILDVNTPN